MCSTKSSSGFSCVTSVFLLLLWGRAFDYATKWEVLYVFLRIELSLKKTTCIWLCCWIVTACIANSSPVCYKTNQNLQILWGKKAITFHKHMLFTVSIRCNTHLFCSFQYDSIFKMMILTLHGSNYNRNFPSVKVGSKFLVKCMSIFK